MSDPPPPIDVGDDEDELAELLLADAVLNEPATGEPNPPPDMGDPLTHPPAPPTPTPAPPTPGPAPTPAPAPAPTPAPPAPAPAPTPPAPAPAPAPAPTPQFVAPVPGQPAPSGGDGSPGFPPNTPWREMTADQQVAYWQHQARRHEARVKEMGDYDQLKTQATEYQKLVEAQQTEHQRAVAEARRQGHAAALTEAGGQLVEQWVRAAAAGRLAEESVNALLLGLDRSKFLHANGGVDTDKVYALVSSIAPAAPAPTPAPAGGAPGQPPQPGQPAPVPAPVVSPPGAPDFGQGQPPAPRRSGLDLGREIARKRFGEPSTPAPAAR